MTDRSAFLHMFCGKLAAGKSTLAAALSRAHATVLLCEDEWLHALYRDELRSGTDYLRCSARLRRVMAPHVTGLLRAGLTVVLDFPANTTEQRGWMRAVLDETRAAHQMHVLTPPDAVCLARLGARNADGAHPFAPSEEMFHAFARHVCKRSAGTPCGEA
jgi:predicted kinase